MAWISIHEQVIGGKLRTLAKELDCSQNEALGMLTSLWIWGINNADREGLIIGATKKDVAKVLSVGMDERIDPLKAVDALIKTKWLDGDSDLYIHDWSEWQSEWYKALTRRGKDAERKQKERAKKKVETKESPPVERAEKDNNTSQPTNPLLKVEKAKVEEYTKDFEEWWNTYPRKIGKGDAYKKYKTRIRDGWTPAELLDAAKNYRSRVLDERTEQKYIKHPKTFLSDTTPFADYIKKSDVAVNKGRNDDNPYAEWRD
jgi:hypothetical protein